MFEADILANRERLAQEIEGKSVFVTGQRPRPMEEIDALFEALTAAFAKRDTTKAEVVTIMKGFLKNFDHEEKGLYLDSKV